jgi:hypothetical protein
MYSREDVANLLGAKDSVALAGQVGSYVGSNGRPCSDYDPRRNPLHVSLWYAVPLKSLSILSVLGHQLQAGSCRRWMIFVTVLVYLVMGLKGI